MGLDTPLYMITSPQPFFGCAQINTISFNLWQSDGGDGVFQDAEQIFQAVAIPGGKNGGEVLREVAEPHLSLICDAKVAGDDTYYRLSERKVHTHTAGEG
jgi:hypothetical protein